MGAAEHSHRELELLFAMRMARTGIEHRFGTSDIHL